MFEQIRRIWREIFPLSAAAAEHRMQSLAADMEALLRAQQRLTGQLDFLRESVNAALAQQEYASREQGRSQEEWIQRLWTAQRGVGQGLDTLASRFDRQEERLASFRQEMAEQVAGLSDGLAQSALELHEIVAGDIFRRIEFLQARIIYLERLIQSNLLTVEEQRSSAAYLFVSRIRALFPLMAVEHPKGFIRIGREHDGGYVMLDDFENRKIAYSFGIADDVSWDTDMAGRGLEIYLYDHTIGGLAAGNERFHFFRTGLCAEENRTGDTKTLPELMRQNGHDGEYGMILKMDIEGAEWEVLCGADETLLQHFSQIVVEFHGLTRPENEGKIAVALKKLNKTHQLVHIHANNYGTSIQLGGAILPELIEGTYLLREEYQFIPNTQDLRWRPDSANNPYLPDIFLGSWNS